MNRFYSVAATSFERWFDWVCHHHYRTLIVCVLVVGSLASQLPTLRLDASAEAFLDEDNPGLLIYDEFREQFGRDDRIVVAIQGVSVFDRKFLERLRSFHQDLEEELPYIEEVESLLNARSVYGTEDELIIEDLFEEWPGTKEDLKRIEDMARQNPMYENVMLSEDGTFTMITSKLRRYAEDLSDSEVLDDLYFDSESEQPETESLELLTEEQSNSVVIALESVIEKHSNDEFKIFAAGQPKMTSYIARAMMRDMGMFSALSVVSIAVLLLVLFRTPTAVIPAILIVVCSLLSTLGCMSLAGSPIQPPTQILPSFLLAVGVADAVHILARFHQQLRKGLEKRDALREAAGFAGLPILFTSLTTAGGLASFVSSDMAPVSALGIFAPIGIAFAFVYTMTLLPALIMILPTPKVTRSEEETLSARILIWLGTMSIEKPVRVILATVVIVIVAITSCFNLHFSHNPLSWLPEDNALRQSTRIIDDAMAGTMSMEILIDKGSDYAFHEPENLRGLEQITDAIEGQSDMVIQVGQSFSIVDVLKEINKGLNGNEETSYRLASDRALISQELLLFENSGSEDLEELVDTIYSKARITLIVNWDDAIQYVPFVAKAKQIALQHFTEDEITVTGLLPIFTSAILMLYTSMAMSYALALIIIVPLVMLIVGSVRMGSLAMAPNILPILLCLGVMGLFNLPIDVFSMLIGGVSIGLVVDDSIHFLHHFKQYFDESESVEQAIAETLRTTGRALLFTTLVLACGFCTFAISSMENLPRFGLLTAMTVSLALVANVILLPALISLVYRKHTAKHAKQEEIVR